MKRRPAAARRVVSGAAVALRPQLVGIGPLLPLIQNDLDITHAVAGLLGTIPILCMGLFAPPAPFVSGPHRAPPCRSLCRWR